MGVIPRGGKFGARVYHRGDWNWVGTFHTREEAQAAHDFAKQARNKSLATITQFADRWIREFNYATKGGRARWGDSTLEQYRGHLRALTRPFGKRRMIEFTITDARTWALGQPEAYVRTAAAMFADARRDELIPQNPFEKLRLPRSEGRRHIVAITFLELEKLCEIARSTWGLTFEAMVAVGGYSMLRPGEIFALTPDAIDYEKGEIHVTHAFSKTGEHKAPKNRKPRRVFMPPDASRRVMSVPRNLKSPWLFVNKRGERFRAGSLHYRWDKVVSAFEAQLPEERRRELQIARGNKEMDFYELRHHGATERLRRGVSPQDVAQEMGHTDATLVTRLYGHPEDEHRLARVKAVFEQNVTELQPVRDAESDAAEG
jgi:integrase